MTVRIREATLKFMSPLFGHCPLGGGFFVPVMYRQTVIWQICSNQLEKMCPRVPVDACSTADILDCLRHVPDGANNENTGRRGFDDDRKNNENTGRRGVVGGNGCRSGGDQWKVLFSPLYHVDHHDHHVHHHDEHHVHDDDHHHHGTGGWRQGWQQSWFAQLKRSRFLPLTLLLWCASFLLFHFANATATCSVGEGGGTASDGCY